MQVSIAVIFMLPSYGCLKNLQRDYDPTRQFLGIAVRITVRITIRGLPPTI
jgi:hypothetical protein